MKKLATFILVCLITVVLAVPAYAHSTAAPIQAVVSASTVRDGWVQKTDGWYYVENGRNKTGWLKSGGKWYFLDSTGRMKTGWLDDGGKRYYLNSSGAMQTGWGLIEGQWYYFNGSGAMLKGWEKVNGKWYFLDRSTGAMKTGWLTDGRKYYLTSSGAMQTGWGLIGGKWYYFESSGAMKTGWIKDGSWYFLDGATGAMKTGWLTDGGKKYYLANSGKMLTGWQAIGGKWYYFNGSGAMATGWQKINGTWYFMDRSSGAMQTGWLKDGNTWYYLTSSGAMQTGWATIGGKKYYFNSSGAMATGQQQIDGKVYTFNAGGALTAGDPDAYRSYSDSTCSITVYKKWYASSWCYCAHVQIKDYSRFSTALASGGYNSGRETVYHAGGRLGALLCVNGDYARNNSGSGNYTNSFAVKAGTIYHWSTYTGDQIRSNPDLVKNSGSCMAYSSRTGRLFGGSSPLGDGSARNSTRLYDAVANRYITDTFCYGPAGLNNGVVSGSNTGNKRPRTLIGTNGNPGDIWIVVAAGDGYQSSSGLTGYEGCKLLKDLGCTYGGHIDGGGSSAMYFRGELLVQSGRDETGEGVADFVFVK